jgi:hypothetical protein
MEDDSAIKKARIAKLNSSNYRTWAVIVKAMIKAKDIWEAIKELLALEAKTLVEDTDDRIAESSSITELKV